MFGSYQESIKILEGMKDTLERCLVLSYRGKESPIAVVLHAKIAAIACAISALKQAWDQEEAEFAKEYHNYHEDRPQPNGAEVEKAFQEGLCYGPYDSAHEDLRCWGEDLKDLDS